MRSQFSIRRRDNHALGVTLGRYTLSKTSSAMPVVRSKEIVQGLFGSHDLPHLVGMKGEMAIFFLMKHASLSGCEP